MPVETIGSIRLNVVDGTRQPVRQDLEFLVRILDGRKQQVATKWVKGPCRGNSVRLPKLTDPGPWSGSSLLVSISNGLE